jgi:hypothetical protein
MISLKENATAICNLKGTIEALETLDTLIENYSEDLPGPAYLMCEYVGDVRIQLERDIMINALKAQRNRLIADLADLGIDANS